MKARSSASTPLVRAIAWIAGLALLLFLGVPVLLLVVAGAPGMSELVHDREVTGSLLLTLGTATAATLIAVACGTGLAYALARRKVRARTLLAAVIDVPLLIPHPVAGIAILLFVARGTPVGALMESAGLRIVGTPAGIVAAMLFVSAPYYINGAREAFARVDPRYELIARTLGDSGWMAIRRIAIPMAARGLTSAAIVTWARAVSEFGAVVVIAYNPKVASVLSFERLTTGGLSAALPVAAALVVISLVPLVLLRALRNDHDEDPR